MRKNLYPPRIGRNYYNESPDIFKNRSVPAGGTATGAIPFTGTVSLPGSPSQEILPPADSSTGIQNPSQRDRFKGYLGNAIYLSRTFLGEAVLVGTNPTLIKQTSQAQPYLVLNPAKALGITNTVIGFNGTVSASGNSESNPIGVASYLNAQVFINITAVTGTWDIGTQALDPTSGLWVNTQTLLAAQGATGDFYFNLGTQGIATDLAFFWVMDTPGSLTMTITVVLKEGSGGSALGFSQTIFIGSAGVSTVSGYPLLEGTSQNFIFGENMQVWAIALVPLVINLFQL